MLAIVLLLLFIFQGSIMEGSTSSHIRSGKRLPQLASSSNVNHENEINNRHLPNNNIDNAKPAAEHGVPVPHPNGGLTQDPDDKRREQSRAYSKTYRLKIDAHIKNLEEKQKTISHRISEKTPMIKFFKDVGSLLETERNTLRGTKTNVISNVEALKAEMHRIQNELEKMKIDKDAKETHIVGTRNFRGNR
ncbi:uncharacterized protein [Cicer arietinum]|uniref:Uncharacterized protein LOC101501287 n=1 Tax=Cicer arietinum TaxID=3827 RepID=A0A1S2Y762_CICAR|nr:uncharacterized protein LOC101501287 [Cicer arietinum]